jgi:D-alanine-D-alanine ligase
VLKLNRKLNVGVLFGGRSVEHEVSIITGLQILKALDTEKYNTVPIYISPQGAWYTGAALLQSGVYLRFKPRDLALREVTLLPKPNVGGLIYLNDRKVLPIDVFLPAFHGDFGEDGCIQGLFELADIPYTGSNVAASAVAMDKYLCKSICRDHGIPVLPAVTVRKDEIQGDFVGLVRRLIKTPGLDDFPFFIKPCHLGSSIGISKAYNERDFANGLVKVFRHDYVALVEPLVESMFEINVSVLRDAQGVVRASVVEVPHTESGLLSYEEKYMRGGKKGQGSVGGMASLIRTINPVMLDSSIKNSVINMAVRAYQALGCGGAVRFDFMHDNQSGQIFFNELNPLPGSFAFYLWIESQPPLLYTELLDEIIASALRSRGVMAGLEKFIGFRALKNSA